MKIDKVTCEVLVCSLVVAGLVGLRVRPSCLVATHKYQPPPPRTAHTQTGARPVHTSSSSFQDKHEIGNYHSEIIAAS